MSHQDAVSSAAVLPSIYTIYWSKVVILYQKHITDSTWISEFRTICRKTNESGAIRQWKPHAQWGEI